MQLGNDSVLWSLVPREAYLVIRMGLARLARKAGLVGSFIFVRRARIACLARNSRTTSNEVRGSGLAIVVKVFMNNAG